MSIKKLFEASDKSLNYLSEKNQKDAFKSVESAQNLEQLSINQKRYVPQVDYSDPANFARYGSARLYYKSAFNRILDYYPYDGSDAEINKFFNGCLDVEKYLLEKKYPRTNGYIKLAADGYSVSSLSRGYGVPTTSEYIDLKGGPGTGSAKSSKLKDLLPNDKSDSYDNSNIYDKNIYQTAGLPSDYGKGTRTSNLRSNFDDGVTVEFWFKSGSIPNWRTKSKKQVIFDLWNKEAIGDAKYGRLRIELTGAFDASGVTSTSLKAPFVIHIASGSTAANNINSASLGTTDLWSKMGGWNHYAITMQNTGSTSGIKLYVNGVLNDHITGSKPTSAAPSVRRPFPKINPLGEKNLIARIGALRTQILDAGSAKSVAGAGKLSGSLDEFRFWKVARTPKQIGEKWFTQVRGGSNNDISNATLGVYYKFNEGITGKTSTDKVVLDYAGRVTNGKWTGYTANSRFTGSAIVLSKAAQKEYLDPIVRTNNPKVMHLETQLEFTGSSHDYGNHTSVLSLVPGWILDQYSEVQNTDLTYITHIMGAYFDKLYLQISEIPKLRQLNYVSSSNKPISFAKHLPQSLGLYSPDLFIDSTVMEKFLNRNTDSLFENDLHNTKNLIYINLYNNLTDIFKSKGTERSIKNIFKCFNIDENLLRLTVNSNNEEFVLRDNLRQQLLENSFLNFNKRENATGVVYQRSSSISGLNAHTVSGSIPGSTKQKPFGFTCEANVMLPYFDHQKSAFARNPRFKTCSIFGSVTVKSGSIPSIKGTNLKEVGSWVDDYANFHAYTVKDEVGSRNARFMLSASLHDSVNEDAMSVVLTSSLFLNAYDNEPWNLSVRVKPVDYPNAYFVTTGSGASDRERYEIIFTGINPRNADVANSFTVKKELPTQIGRRLIETRKRLYVGAERKDVIGELKSRSDVLVSSLTFWTKYLEKNNLHKHALDFENVGISGSNNPIAANVAVTSGSLNQNILNRDTLALHWNFNNVTASSAGGNFTVQDFSSGSIWEKGTGVTQTGDYGSAGWAGRISQHRYPGYAYGFDLSSTDVVDKRQINKYKFIDPEQAVSSDMVQIFSDEDVLFPNLRREEIVPNYVYSIEKSLYNAISEEMLDFFAGVTDFHNLIGAPVNRYRQDYKEIEKLRNAFFRRVKNVAHVESYMEYYKWFDDALSEIIGQLIPLSSEFVDDVMNVVESHVLERNKYQTRMNDIDESLAPKPDGHVFAFGEKMIDITDMIVPPPMSPRPTNKNITFWSKRADRAASEITSNDAAIDIQRNKIRDTVNSVPHYSASKKIKVYTEDLESYDYDKFQQSNFMQLTRLSLDLSHQSNKSKNKQIQRIRGGVNFPPTKNIEFTMNALRPAGPVNTDHDMFVPENVMLAFTKEAVPVKNFKTASVPKEFIKKERRVFKVNHGRNWDDGLSYSNVKSTVAFPFNIFSSSNKTGYNKSVIEQANLGIQITNLHNDAYGDLMEIPMQGPFTDNVVGGLQARHIGINLGNDKPNTRPEAWRILLGTCAGSLNPTGAIGMVGPDYPPPSLQVAAGERGYPYKPYQKAYLYRDMTAKRPVNIKNINVKNAAKTKTVAGNYQNNYEVIHSFGSYDNPRAFIEKQPRLPKQLKEVRHTTNVRTLLDVHRGTNNHFTFVDDYDTGYLTGTTNRTIITNQFSAPGGIETMTNGYLDFKSDSYSPYNCLTFRNLRVLKPWQGPSGTFSQPPGATPSTSRVSDLHGKDYGLDAHYARHTARFGRDSMHVKNPGAIYDQLPGFHKINRNPKQIVRITNTTLTPVYEIAKPLTNTKGLSFGWSGDNDDRSESLIKSGSFSTDFANGISMGIWMYRSYNSNNGQTRCLMSIGDDYNTTSLPNGSPTILLGVTSDFKPFFQVQHIGGNNGYWQLDTAFSVNTWQNIAVTYDGSSTANLPTLYLNGVSQSISMGGSSPQQPAATMPTVTDKIPGHSRIGGLWGGGSNGYRVLTGSTLDEASIHSSVLTAADISKMYCSGKVVDLTSSYAPATASLVTWLRLGDASTAPTTDTQLTSSGASALDRNFPPASKSVFFDVKGNNNFAIRAGTTERANMNYNALNTVTPPDGCTGDLLYYKETNTYTSNSLQYDNLYVQHQIPRASRQYMWLDRSIENVPDLRYSGFQNTSHASMMPYRSSSTNPGGLESFYRIVSASEATINKYYQPINRLNIVVDDPVSSSTNTLGYPATQNTNRYFNRSLIGTVATADRPMYLNNLLSNRKATYGWGWEKFRQRDNKILIKERKENKLSTVESADSPIVRYDLPPVSFKGRPAHVCIGARRPSNAVPGGVRTVNNTYRITSTNEKIFFNETKLNNLTNVDPRDAYSPLKYLLKYARRAGRRLNWVLYTQNVFPSTRNEALSQSTRRIGYDNKFWRNLLVDRITVGDTFNNSFNVDVKQSSWALDAPVNFLTRSRIISKVDNFNKNETKAGELQNTYFAYLTCPGNNSTGQNMFPAALYARKHALGSPRSVVSPQGPAAPGIWKKHVTASFKSANQIDILGGEALWEAATQAGTLHNSIFRVTASNPWFNDYTSFNADLKLKARGYSIIPEYRISEHVEDYYKYGIANKYKQNTFSIPGTQFSSSQKDFYLDYSNTDFLDFLGVKSETLLDASEIRLNCSAAIKYNPYKGFYPAQRTQQLVAQFKNSFENSIAVKSKYATYYGTNVFNNVGGLLKPLFDPLFSPGILYNSIKSGIAVDYPVITDPDKITREYFHGGIGSSGPGAPLNNYAATITGSTTLKQAANGYYSGQWWDQRIPFEAMVDPRKHITNMGLLDMESHPSMSLAVKLSKNGAFSEVVTGSMNDMGDDVYSLMARNFFAGVGEFFLEGAGFTQLKSETVATNLKFKKGSVYMSRIKLRRSHNGKRMYDKETDSFNNAPYGGSNKSYYTRYGARATNKNGRKTRSGYPIPQDPTGSAFKETFTMYSRPTAFGPSFAGRPTGAHAAKNPFRKVAKDSFSGYNPAFTPPYQNGEAWIDLIFKPSASVDYDLEKILAETETMCWRFDPGYSIPRSGPNSAQPSLIPVWSAASSSKPNAITPAGDKTIPSVYDGYRINANSMQATASLNIFGVERIFEQKYGSNGNVISTTNNTVGTRWIIQPKFETPMLNFCDTGPRPISTANGTLTLPQYASSSTARGMWHQFGTIPDKAETGVFMEIGDIPPQWLKNHYLVNQKNSVYNNYNTGSGPALHKKVQSLSSLCGFDRNNSSKRLGNLKERFVVREAIVAVPYILEHLGDTVADGVNSDAAIWKTKKKFISLPPQRVGDRHGAQGNPIAKQGASIAKLKSKLKKYVFPPEFDFLHNPNIDPFAMYVFEFKYEFDKDDLSYIWQNIAPRDYEKISFQSDSCGHKLNNSELINKEILTQKNLRWMLFKVKQRAKADYYDLMPDQAGGATSQIVNKSKNAKEYQIRYNWPYDYLSFVELIKMDVDILLKKGK